MTKYPYEEWLNGRIVLLAAPEDFAPGTEQQVLSAISTTARRNNWNVLCRRSSKPDGQGGLIVWGDKNIPRSSPLPETIREGFLRAGYRLH